MKINEKKAAIEKNISEVEALLHELKDELRVEVEKEQHREIDDLESFLDEFNNRFHNLNSFWTIISDEVKEIFKKKTTGNN